MAEEGKNGIKYNQGSGAAGGAGQFMRGRSSFGSNNAMSLIQNLRNLPKYVRSISDIGIDFSLVGKKNKIGTSRKEFEEFYDEEATLVRLLGEDVQIEDRNLPYFDLKYQQRIEFLNRFSTHPEIEFILHTIADEAIVYDEFGKFCDISTKNLTIDEDTRKTIRKNFNNIYNLLGFDDGITAWAYFLQWLIEGFIALEIIYDNPDNPSRITGFSELPIQTLVHFKIEEEYDEILNNKKTGVKKKRIKKVWKQIVPAPSGEMIERIIPDNSIIVIAANRIPGNRGRYSYAERLIRSFNLMRTMENTKVAWHVMNSQFRLKMVIPVGSQTTAKAKQALAKVAAKYKEDLFIDHDSGQLSINGQARINFGRNIVLPSRGGNEPQIDGVSYNGPDLSNMESVKYFERKLWRDSRLPWSRYDRENGGGTRILFEANGVPHDELAYHKMKNRFRKEFEKLIKVPVYFQTIMDIPALKVDKEFKAKLGIVYESDSLFERAQEQEIESKKVERAANLGSLMKTDGVTPLYSRKFLYVKKTELMTDEEWEENEKMLKDEINQAREDQSNSNY